MKEEAQAIEAIAKATGQAISTVERLGQFLARIMGEPIDSTCGMIGDALKFKRWERQLALIDKAERIANARLAGRPPILVPPKLVLPIFMQASIEDEEEIHTLYASLLASAMDPASDKVRSAYVAILQQVEPIDIHILNCMYCQYSEIHEATVSKYKGKSWFDPDLPPTIEPISSRKIYGELGIDKISFRIAFDNLCRLGLADSYFEEGNVEVEDDSNILDSKLMSSVDTVIVRHGGYDDICITSLGCAFVKSCSVEKSEPPAET
ncbi:MAG: Abi-alpha family protein [Kiritimatiellae bacterium]|nr:Abi-alpha family protein [Kiritimatiellia bacterium]